MDCGARRGRRHAGIPQPETPEKRVVIVAGTGFGRQLLESLHVTAKHDFVGLESGGEQRDHFRDMAAPRLCPFLEQRLVSQMR